MFIGVAPAYGRDYKSMKEVKAAWEAGKDFLITDMVHPNCGAYLNKNDAPKGATINVRFKRQTSVCPIKVK
jgi:hypothetical protein